MAAPQIEVGLGARTDVGQLRDHNEDCFLVVQLDVPGGERDEAKLKIHALGERGTLLLVCDGMGGAAAGEVASRLAVDSIARTMVADVDVARANGFPEAEPNKDVAEVDREPQTALARKLRQAAVTANDEILAEARSNLARGGMGTTMTAALLWRGHALVAQVGDSRCYVLRGETLTQVTRDQSLVNQLIESGHITAEQAKHFEHSNVILQALGVQEDVDVQLSRVALRRDDRLMLCSDGLTGVVTDEELAAVLGSVPDPDEAARLLIEMANTAGGPDNITCVVADVRGEGLPVPATTDVVQYLLWKVAPDVPPSPEGASEAEDLVPPVANRPSGTSDGDDDDADADADAGAPQTATERWSMLGAVAVLVIILLVGLQLYRRGVECRLESSTPGLHVLDGTRELGVRTVEGELLLRLSAGAHVIKLHSGSGSDQAGEDSVGSREVVVVEGAECVINFVADHP